MVTVNAARALGYTQQLGELRRGARADLIAVPWQPRRDVSETVLHHAGPVDASMIDGKWAIPPVT